MLKPLFSIIMPSANLQTQLRNITGDPLPVEPVQSVQCPESHTAKVHSMRLGRLTVKILQQETTSKHPGYQFCTRNHATFPVVHVC